MDTFHELMFRAQLDAIDAEKWAMLAANEYRAHRAESPAFTHDTFMGLADRIAHIEEAIRNQIERG